MKPREEIIFSLEKKSEPNFFEFIIEQLPIIAILFFFVRKKTDKLVISSNSTKLFLRNQLYQEINYHSFQDLTFDSVRPKLENSKSEKLLLEKMMLTYEEIQKIKHVFNTNTGSTA